jgi:outer membrane protein OmpA-like peptidoglycan-associated protein
MKKILFSALTLILFISACTYTQKVKDGKFAYERMQYAVAIDLLNREIKKAKTQAEKAEKAFLLGESYKYINQLAEATTWYKAAYDYGYGTDALKEYAYALKTNQEYAQAMQAFKELGIEIGSPYEYRKEVAACKIAQEWSKEKSKEYTVELANFNSNNSDYSPTLYKGNKLVFTSDRNASLGDEVYNWTGNDFSDLFVVDLDSKIVEPFDNQLNTEFNEGTAVFTKDFSEVYFVRCFGDKKGDYYCKLMMSKINGDRWSVPVVLNFVQDNINYGHPSISEDGSTLYFSCQSSEGWGGYDIWYSERTPEGWSDPRLMSRSINTPSDEKFPFIDKDTLYFSSNGHTSMGGLDVFKTYRMSNGAWTPPKNLKTPINSGGDDFGYIVDYQSNKSKDVLQVGYFSSTRPEGKGSDDIYRFEKRIPPPEPEKPDEPEVVYKMILEGYVLEKIYATPGDPDSKYLGRRPLNRASVKVTFGDETLTFDTGSDGFFTFELEENTDYNFLGSRDGFLNNETTFSTKGIGKDPNFPVQKFEVELVLDQILIDKEIVLEDIYYDFDKWDIRKDAEPSLNRLAQTLKLNPDLIIQLGSHTDCRGNDRYNQDLSQKRAQSAVNYLITKGIASERLIAKGFGESDPKADCACSRCDEEEHQENRRTSFRILENG